MQIWAALGLHGLLTQEVGFVRAKKGMPERFGRRWPII